MNGEEWNTVITPEEIVLFQRRHGKNSAAKIFEAIVKKNSAYKALSQQPAQAIIADLLDGMNKSIENIISGKAVERDIIKYEVQREILDSWAVTISRYKNYVEHVKKGGSNG